jgi:hypothetical protein
VSGVQGYLIKDFFLNYEARMKDFTVRLGSRSPVEFHNGHAEDGWAVTLAETRGGGVDRRQASTGSPLPGKAGRSVSLMVMVWGK